MEPQQEGQTTTSTMRQPETSPDGSVAGSDLTRLSKRLNTRRRTAAKEQIEGVFTQYLQEVQALGIVSEILVGSKAHAPGAYLWNVFAEDFRVEQWARPSFAELNRLTYRLEQDLPKGLSLRIAHVNPCDLAQVRERCDQQQIETELIPLR